jgi:hypothetical protein
MHNLCFPCNFHKTVQSKQSTISSKVTGRVCEKVTQSVTQPIFLSELVRNFHLFKRSLMHIVNNHSIAKIRPLWSPWLQVKLLNTHAQHKSCFQLLQRMRNVSTCSLSLVYQEFERSFKNKNFYTAVPCCLKCQMKTAF